MKNLTITGHNITITGTLPPGDLADFHTGTDTNGTAIIVKHGRVAANNDLMLNERETLNALTADTNPQPGELPELDAIQRIQYKAYLPNLLGSVIVDSDRIANVFEQLDGMYSLATILNDLGPLDPKDIAWMWRRLLVAIGFVHEQGYVHGAIIPEHIMIHPEQHGLVLVGWSHAVPIGEPLQTIVGRYRHLYPPSVTQRAPTTSRLDVEMAARVMIQATDTPPSWLRGYAHACTLTDTTAWSLQHELDRLLERNWGPKKFHPFVYPTT